LAAEALADKKRFPAQRTQTETARAELAREQPKNIPNLKVSAGTTPVQNTHPNLNSHRQNDSIAPRCVTKRRERNSPWASDPPHTWIFLRRY